MIYFRHFSSMRNDDKISALREEFGLDGYAVPVMILEIIADCYGPSHMTPRKTFSARKWAAEVGLSTKRFLQIVRRMRDHSLFKVEITDTVVTISIPNLPKYCDKYTQELIRTGKISAQKSDQISAQENGQNLPQETNKQRKERKERNASSPSTGVLEPPVEATPEERKQGHQLLKAALNALERPARQDHPEPQDPQPAGNEEDQRPEPTQEELNQIQEELDSAEADLIEQGIPPAKAGMITKIAFLFRKGSIGAEAMSARISPLCGNHQEKIRVLAIPGLLGPRT